MHPQQFDFDPSDDPPPTSEAFMDPFEEGTGGAPDDKAVEVGPDPATYVRRMLEILLADEDKAAVAVGRRVLFMAYLFELPGIPRSQRALAKLCGTSVGFVNGEIAAFRKEFAKSTVRRERTR